LLAHWYHAFADGAWQAPVTEHLRAIEPIPFERKYLGVVGTPEHRAELLPHFPGWEVVVEADTGYEELTLNCLRNYAQDAVSKVLYMHTKGASYPHPINDAWRRNMTKLAAGQWERCVALLDEYDVVGSYWLTPEKWGVKLIGPWPIFGGNFWWATTTHLRRLPPIVAPFTRWNSEVWVGKANPRAFCLRDGWPPGISPP
jgi:hypothetical protein